MTKINRIVKYEVDGLVFDKLEDAEARLKELLGGVEETYKEFVNGTLSNHINSGQPFNVNDTDHWIVYDPNYNILYFALGTLEDTLKDALREPDFEQNGYIKKMAFKAV